MVQFNDEARKFIVNMGLFFKEGDAIIDGHAPVASHEYIVTSNQQHFEVAEDHYGFHFRVGTCTGLWGSTDDSYYILAVENHKPGNGHLNDVFEWFEFSCKRDKKNLLVLEIINPDFYIHLISKRGFIALDTYGQNCIKIFNQEEYERLLTAGNSIIDAKTLTCI